MIALLIAFTQEAPPLHPWGHGSFILNASRLPATTQDLVDLQAVIGMEYSGKVAILNWDLLPDANDHPSVGMPYCYYVGYFFTGNASNWGSGSMSIMRTQPLLTIEDLRGLEEYIRSLNMFRTVRLASCKPLHSLSDAEMARFRQDIGMSEH
jgi:hypothetical protein